MPVEWAFRRYGPGDRQHCLRLFDANCPEFFAPGERAAYEAFLDAAPEGYEVCVTGGRIVGAYGLIGDNEVRRSLKWILIAPEQQRSGIGSAIIHRVTGLARTARLRLVTIAASHKSAPFFARFGALAVSHSENGWGPGMHRVDMELILEGLE